LSRWMHGTQAFITSWTRYGYCESHSQMTPIYLFFIQRLIMLCGSIAYSLYWPPQDWHALRVPNADRVRYAWSGQRQCEEHPKHSSQGWRSCVQNQIHNKASVYHFHFAFLVPSFSFRTFLMQPSARSFGKPSFVTTTMKKYSSS
jgi:hypothetical protein